MGTRQGVLVGIVAAALGVLVAQPLAGTAAILPQRTAGSAAPQLSVPSVTVPAVSTPLGTTPSVTTPAVSVPSVTTPRVSTPIATVPAVTTPQVNTPSVSAPSATAPVRSAASKLSALVGGAPRSAQASGAPGDPASAAPDTSAVTGLAGSGTASPVGSGAGTAAAPAMARDAHTAVARGRTGAADRGSAHARRAAAARRESRRLRHLVSTLHGCLGTLGVGARRLLTLRAGLHGRARSAAATARILRLSTGHEARLERLALAGLKLTARTGCAGPATTVARGHGSAGTLSASAPQLGDAPAASGPAASLSAAHAERSARGGRGPAPQAVRPAASEVQRAATGSSFPSVLVSALLALLLALAVIALPETRRRLGPAVAPAGAGAASTRDRAAGTLPPHAPIAYPATAAPRRSTLPGSEAAGTGMDDTLEQMAANIVAQMRRDAPIADAHPGAQAYGLNTHVEVERELLPGPRVTASHHQPAPWRPGPWAREHATRAALVATVVLGWLARMLRRGRRRRRGHSSD